MYAFFASLAGGLLALIGRKGLVSAASVAAFVALTAAFIVAIQALLTAVLAGLAVPTSLTYPIGLFIPSNFVGCLSAIISAHATRAAYDLAMDKVKVLATAS